MNESDMPRLLIIGGPDSGKSTYRAQFVLRLMHNPGALKLDKSVGDWSAIDADVQRLMSGLQVLHTPADTFHSTSIEIANASGISCVLDFADYGGEQIRKMATSNAIAAHWTDVVRNADSWLIFLRIDRIRATKSFMEEKIESAPTTTTPPASKNLTALKHDSSTEIGTIEILQRLLFLKGAPLQYPLHAPRLAVALSCWDEVPTNERKMSPLDLLRMKAPLLASFLRANWESAHLQVYALSSTDGVLSETIPNQAFLDRGPENMGYVRPEDGPQSTDLTLPIAWLMQRR